MKTTLSAKKFIDTLLRLQMSMENDELVEKISLTGLLARLIVEICDEAQIEAFAVEIEKTQLNLKKDLCQTLSR